MNILCPSSTVPLMPLLLLYRNIPPSCCGVFCLIYSRLAAKVRHNDTLEYIDGSLLPLVLYIALSTTVERASHFCIQSSYSRTIAQCAVALEHGTYI